MSGAINCHLIFFSYAWHPLGLNEPQWYPQLLLQSCRSCFMTASSKVPVEATWLLGAVPVLKQVLLRECSVPCKGARGMLGWQQHGKVLICLGLLFCMKKGGYLSV